MAVKELDKIVQEKVPSHQLLEGRFLFIDNEILRTNIVITFQYIIFLITLEEETELQGPTSYSIYKDIIVQSATIVESCLHYCLNKHIENGIIDNVVEVKDDFKKPKKIYDVSDDLSLYICIKKKEFVKLNNTTDFYKINKMAKASGVLDNELFKDAEKIREDRNKIHLASLTEKDAYFTKRDVHDTFSRARKIIEAIENKIKQI
ncbi:hypothetical protein KJ785_04920 [Patescibacteria group bacterium]|nr:hypothetical protein [Patescibacteria group bacterium]